LINFISLFIEFALYSILILFLPRSLSIQSVQADEKPSIDLQKIAFLFILIALLEQAFEHAPQKTHFSLSTMTLLSFLHIIFTGHDITQSSHFEGHFFSSIIIFPENSLFIFSPLISSNPFNSADLLFDLK